MSVRSFEDLPALQRSVKRTSKPPMEWGGRSQTVICSIAAGLLLLFCLAVAAGWLLYRQGHGQ